ncbi:DUF883 family protein [Opitutus sp. ER46]|uniref:DUF883 family protein n=1 Tax=Opitutus sp. ER46 TaxID=2161864 RepID=UPI000D2F9534|nr:DUF883 family protein [Opitutus sp. ER46]PTX98589.1 DUF883 domain-containing protein [Opitutus sp. ER46]
METYFPDMDEAQSRIARERVMDDLRTLAADAEALLRATADDASGAAKETRARLAAAVEKAKATCEDLHARGLASAREAAKKADTTIRAHPYESIAVAFGVGVLLGVLLRRK